MTGFVVQAAFDCGVAGVFTAKSTADEYLAAIERCGADEYEVQEHTVDDPVKCSPIVGVEVAMLEGREARDMGRVIIGEREDHATLQEFGVNKGLIWARVFRSTEAEGRGAAAELITAERAKVGASGRSENEGRTR